VRVVASCVLVCGADARRAQRSSADRVLFPPDQVLHLGCTLVDRVCCGAELCCLGSRLGPRFVYLVSQPQISHVLQGRVWGLYKCVRCSRLYISSTTTNPHNMLPLLPCCSFFPSRTVGVSLHRMLLGAPTAWFRTWRIGLFKNLALIVVYCVWCGWPFGIAMWVDRVWAWVIAGVVCLLFVWRGYIVVEDNWKVREAPRPQWHPCVLRVCRECASF